MTGPLLWLLVGLLLVGAEVLSGEFVLLMLGGGALAGAAAAFLGVGFAGSAAVFAVASVLLLFAVRPVLRRRLDRSLPHSPSRMDALVGGPATVLTRVDGHGGRVRIGDDEWSARAFDGSQVIEVGERVTVVQIAGATALVLAEK